jgi:hypothetical protein
MKLSLLVALVTLALALGLSAPASAATANPQASCAGLAGASRAGQPGAQAEVVFDVIADARDDVPPAPGTIFGGFARTHQGTAESCLS